MRHEYISICSFWKRNERTELTMARTLVWDPVVMVTRIHYDLHERAINLIRKTNCCAEDWNENGKSYTICIVTTHRWKISALATMTQHKGAFRVIFILNFLAAQFPQLISGFPQGWQQTLRTHTKKRNKRGKKPSVFSECLRARAGCRKVQTHLNRKPVGSSSLTEND